MDNKRHPSLISRLVKAAGAFAIGAVTLTSSPVSAETASGQLGDHHIDGAVNVQGEREQPARTTAANSIEQPGFTFTACPWMTDSVVRLYSAYFLRAPDEEGFNFWVEEYSLGNWSLPRMSGFFAESPEFIEMYGSRSDAEFIELIYNNILGRQSDESGRLYWLDRMKNEGLDRGTVMLFFSESREYVEQSLTARPLAGEFNWYPEGTEWYCGQGDIDAAVPEDAFVDIAMFNYTNRDISLSIDEWVDGRWLNSAIDTLEPETFLIYFGIEWDSSYSTGLRITSSDDFVWILVYSEVRTPQVRTGWEPI